MEGEVYQLSVSGRVYDIRVISGSAWYARKSYEEVQQPPPSLGGLGGGLAEFVWYN